MISEKVMIIDKEYALVDATARLNTDLRDYEYEINNAAIITFGNDLIEVIVYQFSFVGNDSNLLIVFYVQIMPDDFVMQLHRF